MICSVFDLLREYNGIKDVNCYLIFIDLESRDSKNQFNLIIQYILKYCNLSKKIYIIGLYNNYLKDSQKYLDEDEIKEIIKETKINKFIYKEMNLDDSQKISDFILEIFVNVESASTKKKIIKENKEGCLIY